MNAFVMVSVASQHFQVLTHGSWTVTILLQQPYYLIVVGLFTFLMRLIIKIKLKYLNFDNASRGENDTFSNKACRIYTNISYRKTKFVVAANTLRESGDQETKLIPPPPTRFRGTALSRPTAQIYMVLSTALPLTNKSP